MQLLKHLWLLDENNIEIYGENKSYSPYQFKNVLGKLNDLILKNEPNESKDLIIYIQEKLHKELNFLFEKITTKNDNNDNLNINKYNENQAKSDYFQHFSNNYKSIISDLFYGTQKIVTNCKVCGVKSYNFQIFTNLIFPLEAIRQFKGNQNCKRNIVYVTFDDCLQYFQQNNYFTGQNRISCNNCKALRDVYYATKISIAPNILIIILNRGKGLDFNVNLDITENINISKYVESVESPFLFDLIGAIIHNGNSGRDGQFSAICKNKNNGQWYKYNDSIVTKSDFSEIKKEGIPYVLFYQKRY